MSKFEVLLLQPNVSDRGASGIDKEYTEEALRESVDSLDGKPVHLDQSEPDAGSIVGEVVDAEYEEGEGVRCTVRVEDDKVAQLLEDGVTQLAPRLFHEQLDDCSSETEITEVTFDSIFTTQLPTEQVGKTEPV